MAGFEHRCAGGGALRPASASPDKKEETPGIIPQRLQKEGTFITQLSYTIIIHNFIVYVKGCTSCKAHTLAQ